MEHPDQELSEAAAGLKQQPEAGPEPLPLLLKDQSLELEINRPQIMIIHPGPPVWPASLLSQAPKFESEFEPICIVLRKFSPEIISLSCHNCTELHLTSLKH